MKKFFPLLCLFFLFISFSAHAWNSVGHQLVAQIAYDQLTSKEKSYWNNRIKAMRLVYPKENFIHSSTFPDELKARGIRAYSYWHFIDLPIFLSPHSSNIHPQFIEPHNNLIWAINEAINVEKDSKATSFEKAFFASFLIHLVADAHQPLHCSELYSSHFPHGDRGGNLFYLNSHKFPNLHADWDMGGGFLSWKRIHNKHALQMTAYALEKKYPPSFFGKRINNLNPKVWAKESHALAKTKAYIIQEYSVPSYIYQAQVQKVTQEQITLAGYRLGKILKSLAN